MFKNKKILVIGGAGSIGSELTRQLLKYTPRIVRILDNNETGLFDLQNELNDSKLRFLVGDVRDLERLKVAMDSVDYVFHAAALKHVPYSEYNPFETIKTNIVGTQNVINAALTKEVKKVISISTDKAVNPISTMGATKLLTEKLITAINYYKGTKKTVFSSIRFGNVVGSRGSILPLFIEQIKKGGPITLTSDKMTRFMMSIEQAMKLVLKAAKYTKGGEIFVLKMPAVRIKDFVDVLIETYAPKFSFKPEEIKIKSIGKRPGEKYYEELLTKHELDNVIELEDMFVILPTIFDKKLLKLLGYKEDYKFYKPREEEYLSDKKVLLTKGEIKRIFNIY